MNKSHKTAVIFGGTSGVGKRTAIDMALQNWNVVIVGRKDGGAVAEIQNLAPQVSISFFEADLSQQKAVKQVVAKISDKYPSVEALAITIGVMLPNLRRNADGLDLNVVLNYLVHVWIIEAMLPLLKAAEQSRIVMVGGLPLFLKLAQKSELSFNETTEKYNANRISAATLASRMLLTKYYANRLQDDNITVNLFHPGLIKDSHLGGDTSWVMKLIGNVMGHFSRKDQPIGCHLLTEPKYARYSGDFFNEKGELMSLPAWYSTENAMNLIQRTQPFM